MDEPESSEQSEQAEPEKSKRKKYIYQDLETRELYLKVLVPYLDNPYEEVISERRHEAIRFSHEEVGMLKQKHLKPWQ